MICLGIETSCDETALAIVQDGLLLASVLSSQADMHALFGGVVPELASREHSRLIGPLYDVLLRDARIDPLQIDTIAFARGPGLLGSLLVGASFAKALALGISRRLIGVNHLHAHLLVAGLEGMLIFPALGLLVSGGHTHIYRILSHREFICLGRALDDAAGESFDKIGKLLNLPYPAGRRINELALAGKAIPGLFKPPYLRNDNLNFSFSGLKTAAAAVIREKKTLETKGNSAKWSLEDFCASLNMAIATTLRQKFERALQREKGIRSLLLAGGVAANSFVRDAVASLAQEYSLPLSVPSPELCTDNGSMIAYAGFLLAQEGWEHRLDVSCIPRGTPVPADMLFRPAD